MIVSGQDAKRRWEKADKFLYPAINIVLFGALILSGYDLFVFHQGQYRFTLLTMVGLLSFISGLIIYSVAQLTLGRFYSQKLRITTGHELRTNGIYKYVRHPYYLGSILSWPGLALFLNSISGFIGMLFVVLLLLMRIHYEEEMLIEAFGQRYIDYKARTKRLIPFLY